MNTTNWIQALSAVATTLLTLALVWLTRQYANANDRMARALERDFAERHQPNPEVAYRVEHRDRWLYSLDVTLSSKGLAPLRFESVSVVHGNRELTRLEGLILSPGEVRSLPSVTFSLHDLAADMLKEGQPITLDLTVVYRELDGTTREIVRHPWVEYRKRFEGRKPWG